MLGKPDRYKYVNPADLMQVKTNQFPLTNDQYRLTDYHIPVQQRGDLDRPQVMDPHLYQPINQVKLHNGTVKQLNPLKVMKAFNQPRMINYRKYYDPEHLALNSHYQKRYQGYEAYGKPYTTYLRAFAIYAIGCGIAMKQGYYGLRFWRFHFFDWIRFIKLGAIFGYGGGGLVGMTLWGDPDLAFCRFKSWFQTKQYDDPYTLEKNLNPMPRI